MVSRSVRSTSIRAIATARWSVATKTASWPCGWAGRRSRDSRRARPRQWSASVRAGPFTSYGDFVARTGLTTAVLSRLAAADAFRSLGSHPPAGLWMSLAPTPTEPLLRRSCRRSSASIYRGSRPLRKSFTTTMPRDCRSGAIRSPRCERFWSTKGRAGISHSRRESQPALSRRRLGARETAPGNRQGNHVHDARR